MSNYKSGNGGQCMSRTCVLCGMTWISATGFKPLNGKDYQCAAGSGCSSGTAA